MNSNLFLLLGVVSTITPYALLILRRIGKVDDAVSALTVDVAGRSARQDTTLEDHERRLTLGEAWREAHVELHH